MFTGIIKQKGKINNIQSKAEGLDISVYCPGLSEDIAVGDSISVDGCCLTAASRDGNGFRAQVSYQTIKNTTLGDLGAGSLVNLEPALRTGDKMGGHMVTGHIDTVGNIMEIQNMGDAYRMVFSVPGQYSRFIAQRGSIAVDGISLTISEKAEDWFGAAIIPHTYNSTTLCNKGPGHPVNIEVDIIARYVANYIGYNKDRILEDKLKKYGFIK